MRPGVRLLVDGHLPARLNMARDEALLDEGTPTVRLYGWRPAAVSLGRSQGAEAFDAAVAAELGLDVVERATGGGAILHEESEVTYAVVLPLDYPGLPADVPGSFAFLSAGVVNALTDLGLRPDVAFDGSAKASENLCYLRRQGTNVLVGGRKISGGAQRRTRTHVLQHGTVIVERDAVRLARLFRAPVADVEARVTSLASEGIAVTRSTLVDALVRGFSRSLEAPLIPGAARMPDVAAIPFQEPPTKQETPIHAHR